MKTKHHCYVLALAMLVGMDHLAANADEIDNRRLATLFEKAKAGGLKDGMSAVQVESIMGRPDNADWTSEFRHCQNTIRVWLSVEKQVAELASWRDFLKDRKRFESGFFFIIIDDHLKSPVPALSSKDFVVLHNLAKGDATTGPKAPASPPGEK